MSMPKTRYGMLIDLRRCIGCHACSIACKAQYEVPLGSYRTWVKQIEKGRYPYVRKAFLPSLCNHCERPICCTVCPVKATYARPEDGLVMINPHRCIGCRYCMAACPYNVRFVNPRFNIVEKCDFCQKLIDQGLEPACVAACPTHALIFGDVYEPNSEIARLLPTSPVQVIKPEMGTYPQIFYIDMDLDIVGAR
jgi:tetrathionate reductase subunit B